MGSSPERVVLKKIFGVRFPSGARIAKFFTLELLTLLRLAFSTVALRLRSERGCVEDQPQQRKAVQCLRSFETPDTADHSKVFPIVSLALA
jgi:hypothetical protein